MTTENLPSGETANVSDDGNKTNENDVVRYDTHRKLLEEKKRVQEKARLLEEKVAAYESERERLAREELEKQGNYQKLLEQERLEKQKIEAEHRSLVESLHAARKIASVKKYIQGTVYDDVLHKMVSTDGIAINEDGSVDENTAKLVAQQFEKTYPGLVMRDQRNGGLPNEAAKGNSGTKLTYQEWKNLGSAAEMRTRQKDVDWSTAD